MILLKFPVRLQTELSGVTKVLPSFWANKESVNNHTYAKANPFGHPIMLCCYEDMKFPSNKERNIFFSFFISLYIGLQHHNNTFVAGIYKKEISY